MCGLVGAAGEITHKDLKVFKELLQVDTLRGDDSTGVAIINRHGSPDICKRTINGYDFVEDHGSFIMKGIREYALIGHNRARTRGAVSKSNAHPFEAGSVVGAHNGTVEEQFVRKVGTEYTQYGTDSEGLLNAIADKGADEVVSNLPADNPKAAYSFVWWDTEEKTLNMLRNEQRPMFFAYSEGRKTIYWSSELGSLRWILGRNGVKLDEREDGHSFFHTLEHKHHIWKLPLTGKPIPHHTVKDCPMGKPLATVSQTSYAAGYAGRNNNVTPFKRTQDELWAKKRKVDVSSSEEWSQNRKKLFLKKTVQGDSHGSECAACGAPVRKEDSFLAIHHATEGNFVICDSCSSNTEIQDDLQDVFNVSTNGTFIQ